MQKILAEKSDEQLKPFNEEVATKSREKRQKLAFKKHQTHGNDTAKLMQITAVMC